MRLPARRALLVIIILLPFLAVAQTPQPRMSLKDEMRLPWLRSDTNYFRQWLVLGVFPGGLEKDYLTASGGESQVRPKDGQEVKREDGTAIRWHSVKTYSDDINLDDVTGIRDSAVAYAFATFKRSEAGKALLSMGSLNGLRVWLNGTPVLSRDGLRSATPDEDQVELPMNAGENTLLVKSIAGGQFYARVLETGAVLPRRSEIGASLITLTPDGFSVRTDISRERADADAVKIEVIRPGGTVVFDEKADRGDTVAVDAKEWPDGPYEVRCSTLTPEGLLFSTHLPWYKGAWRPKAQALEAEAAVADRTKPEGATLRMLADMVQDRLGAKPDEVKGNPWQKVHSPLMEFDELMLERSGSTGRIRPYGFLRIAYIDDVDGTVQYCRAYLPPHYSPSKKYPVVVAIHGYNGANPPYIRWWSADNRHIGSNGEYANHEEVIYVEPHGRGNTRYVGIGDKDIMTVIAEVKKLLSVDDDRVYLTGDSMGGWGTWLVGTRHPDLFAAIAPVFGGSDYHADLSEEELGRLTPMERFINEKASSWAMADGLLNVPIFVRHGDIDQAVKVDYSRWGVQLLQRWGYDIRYHEYPGRVHEALTYHNGSMNINWLLTHTRNANPRRVRLRSAELRHASAYWVRALQAASPLDFMVADASIVDRNVISLDSKNILAFDLTPSFELVDPHKPITVVWNGVPTRQEMVDGVVHVSAPDYVPAPVVKNAALPGSLTDFIVTPFAIVVGTTSSDTAMVRACKERAGIFVESWRQWQLQTPRVFADTAIDDSALAAYSLLLIGGPEANKVTASMGDQIPLKVTADRIAIDGKEFRANNAAVEMISPHPRNPERYVLTVAATSADGLGYAEMNPQGFPDWDYVIADGHLPAYGQRTSELALNTVSGMFDCNWRYRDSLAIRGDEGARAKAHVFRRPAKDYTIKAEILDACIGRYQIDHGPVVNVVKQGKRLVGSVEGSTMQFELLPQDSWNYYFPEGNIWITFVRDAKGRVTGLNGHERGDFEGKKLP